LNTQHSAPRVRFMKIALPLCLSLLAAPLAAHPHIFVNTGLVFVVDDQSRLTHVQVTWEYDELYSLLVTEDLGVDSDYDGVLTAADIDLLTGFDMNWIEGFNGDLVGTVAGQAVQLSQPMSATADFKDGKITTTHIRSIAGSPSLAEGAVFKPYDATFYTAYDVTLPVQVKGNPACEIEMQVPDVKGALALLQAEIAALPEDYDMEAMGFGNIGVQFATEVEIACAAS